MSGFEPSAGPASRKGRRRVLEELLPGGRAVPRDAAGRRCGETLPSCAAAQRCQQVGEQPPTRPPPGSPRRVTHRRERALGSSSAPAPRGPRRRRGRGVPWAAAAGPHRARRRRPQRCGGRDGHGRPGRARSAGSAGPTACVL